MNAMDIEKTMEFILSTQARVEASIERLEASARGHEERITKLETSMATVTDLVGRLAQTEIRLVERVDSLAERMEAGFREVRAIQADTEYKLNALIETVDKLVRRNGHKE
jgi:t-SNARE complex subunit (syntaxin)